MQSSKRLLSHVNKTFGTLEFCRRWLEREDGGSFAVHQILFERIADDASEIEIEIVESDWSGRRCHGPMFGTLARTTSELEGDILTLNILQSQFVGWKKELSADLGTSRRCMTELVRQEGTRCHILLNQHRMNYYTSHTWTLLSSMEDTDTTITTTLEKQWKETKREASVHRQKDLEAKLLEQALETV
jgi:hypothetical protein